MQNLKFGILRFENRKMRNSYAFYWLLYVPISVLYYFISQYYLMSLKLSYIILYPCITLCPWNSPVLLYTPVLPYVPETLLYYFIPLYYLMSLKLSYITLYPCITLCPWNSPVLLYIPVLPYVPGTLQRTVSPGCPRP